jgi:Ca2+-transporting ATPase
MTLWHMKETEQALEALSVTREGLTDAEASSRLLKFGSNELKEAAGRSPAMMLWEQLTQTMVLILIVAAIVSGLLGKATETAAILAIVVLFAALGFLQEFRAERAMAALKKMAMPNVRVRRGNQTKEVSSCELVPGDIVLLEAGNAIPADVRLIETFNLRVQEAALTGESEPVEKETAALGNAALPLGDRINMAYMGTAATYGRGTALVVETGMSTQLGKIAGMIQNVGHEPTPLQRRLDTVGKILAVIGIAAASLVMFLGISQGKEVTEMFLTAVSVAVAVVPEGLPAVVTITLALGAQRMLMRKALIRKLPAVETLGSVTVICSDKTGTLTENRMTVTCIEADDARIELSGSEIPKFVPKPVFFTIAAGALCNDSQLMPAEGGGPDTVLGDPTEGALLVVADKVLDRWKLADMLPRVEELPFDSDRKRMTTVHRPVSTEGVPGLANVLQGKAYLSITKGAVDGLLGLSTHLLQEGCLAPLDEPLRARVQAANESLAMQGVRVLGVAAKGVDSTPKNKEELEQGLVFVGLAGMIDPPRETARSAVASCLSAGVRPMMITGDHPLTAVAIARDLGITDSDKVVTGLELNHMDDAALERVVEDVSVYARVSPEDKLRIVHALQKRGHIVAMTGDGVNDSPALKRAEIGVAMGITGTDVAKEAADMVLLDDNFATIVAAVEEGRVIYDNLLRFIKFSLGGNVGKVLVMLIAPLLGMTTALRPLQLLWLNLLTDGLMGLGLGVEPAETNIMKRPPRRPDAPVFDMRAMFQITWTGILIAAVALTAGYLYYDPDHPEDMTWQTMLFAVIGFAQIGNAIGVRASSHSAFSVFSNPMMSVVTIATIGLQLAAIYLPWFESFFELVPLALPDLALAACTGVLTFGSARLEKSLY